MLNCILICTFILSFNLILIHLREVIIKNNSNAEKDKILDTEWYPIGRLLSREAVDVNSVLRKIILFSDLKEREWKELEQLFHQRRYAEGEPVFQAGVPGMGMYIVIEGVVKIFHKLGEESIEVASFTTGDFFGEMSLIEETVRSANAIAGTQTLLVGLFRPQLLDLIRRRPRFGLKIMEKLAKILSIRLREANKKISEYRNLYLMEKDKQCTTP